MVTKQDILRKIEQYHADFVRENPKLESNTVDEIFDLYFYEESDDLPAVGFNPQSGEHLRIGEKLYYHPDYSHLVPELLREDLRNAKLDD